MYSATIEIEKNIREGISGRKDYRFIIALSESYCIYYFQYVFFQEH